MARLRRRTISKRTVESLPVGERDAAHWDRELPGFGVRVYPTGAKVYIAQTRAGGKSRRVTLGRHGVISADQARRKAALVIACIKAGEEAIPGSGAARLDAGPTVAEAAERYLREHVAVRCKPRTVEQVRFVFARYILPEMGALPLGEVGRERVAALHYRLRETPAMANRAVAVLSRLFYMAEAWGFHSEGGNPCRFVRKYEERGRERFLSEKEFRRLGRALREAEGRVSSAAVAAIRLLMLTGCRRNEVLTLRWEDVDLEAGELRLRDAKTGARSVALSSSAIRVLSDVSRLPDNPWVFTGRARGSRLSNVNTPWLVVRARAGLEDVRIHDLRHSFASRALALGESLPMIGKLLGHTQVQTTARYAHLARDSVKASARKIADSIETDMLAGTPKSDAVCS